MLLTQIRTGLSLTMSGAADRQINGPTSSKADNLLDSRLPSKLTPALIFRPHGT